MASYSRAVLHRLALPLLAALLLCGCGAAVTLSEDITLIEAPPSELRSVGRVSAFGYATDGEHYTIVHGLGDPLAEPIQTDATGHYQMR